MNRTHNFFYAIGLMIGLFFYGIQSTYAHCDTMDGPVIADAKTALEKGEVTPVLKWVKEEFEGEIRKAFQKTMKARILGPDAQEVADRYFFETLVRIHRMGEGAPFTGLKESGEEIDPIIRQADHALESSSINELADEIAALVKTAIQQRFVQAVESKKHKDGSVAEGREYVKTYVEFMHFVERLYHEAKGDLPAMEDTHTSNAKHEHE